MGWGTESPEDCWFQRHCLQGPAPPPAPLPSSTAAPAQGIADASQEHAPGMWGREVFGQGTQMSGSQCSSAQGHVWSRGRQGLTCEGR